MASENFQVNTNTSLETENESEDGLYLPMAPPAQIHHPRPQSLSLLQSPLHTLDAQNDNYHEQPYQQQQQPHYLPVGDDADRTPVIEDGRLESTAQTFPTPPMAGQVDSNATIRQRPLKQSSSLLSPFTPRFTNDTQHQQQPLPPQPQFVYNDVATEYSPIESYPQQVMYAESPATAGSMYFAGPAISPHQSPYGTYPVQMSPYVSGPIYHVSPSQHQMPFTEPLPSQPQMPAYPQAVTPQYAFADQPPRSRAGSPDSVAQSQTSSVSLARSHSTTSSGPMALTSRPKIKLTHEDKRRICEIAKEYTSLRQEDIAKQYGVDRSTISKILLSATRWTAEPRPTQLAPSKEPRLVGGRFPAVEERMHEWLDCELAAGRDVKDSVARECARHMGAELGYGDRFKASTKWWDKFKERRRAIGRPVVTPHSAASADALHGLQMHPNGYYGHHHQQYYQEYPVGQMYASNFSPAASSDLLSRSHSTATLSSTSSSGNERHQVYLGTPHRGPISANKSDSDLLTHYTAEADVGYVNSPNRQRSQSSPQVMNADAGHMSPSSGKVRTQRPATSSLSRQNSLSGRLSPSPRRAGLTRANSSSSNLLVSSRRANRPPSLAASAFGLTPLSQDGNWSPMPSPTTSGSSAGTHSRRRSEVNGGAPFTSSLSVMSISPDIATPASGMMQPGMIPPLTPLSPKSYIGYSEDYQYAPQQMIYQQPMSYPGYPIVHPSRHSPPVPAEQWQ